MKTIFAWLLCAFVLNFSNAWADGKSYLAERRALLGPPGLNLLPQPTVENTYDQKLDHFNAADTRVFKQRYFLNSSFAKGPDSPVILNMCGEGTCDESYFFGEIKQHAQAIGAYLIELEHRYYGKSQPFPSLSAENMRYLTVEQALADNADFQRYAADKLGLKGKWVVMGGSYSGALSAYYRLKNPTLVLGSLASSAPVQAKADFEEYDLQVASVVTSACAKVLRTVTKSIENSLSDAQTAAKVKLLFGADQVQDNTDFLYIVADMAAAAVQYGMKDQFCSAITTAADPITAYALAGKRAFGELGMTPFQDSFQFAESENPDDYLSVGFGARQWYYQSCTQFGFFQVSYHDPAVTVRSTKINLQFHLDVCKKLFGLTEPVDTDKINQNYYQPILNPDLGNRILFTNGSNDPWSNLSISKVLGNDTNPNLDYFMIDGASHCADFNLSSSPNVQKAQALFESLMKQWLGL